MICEGRVVAHGFGAADWRVSLNDLRRRGLIDGQGRPTGCGGKRGVGGPAFRLDPRRRIEAAARIWDGGRVATAAGLTALHLRGRSVMWEEGWLDLRDHASAPVSVYGRGRRTCNAMMARISAPTGVLTGIELTYLAPNGDQAVGLSVSRKTVGAVPAGSAVRLATIGPSMVVGEGVLTTLSASRRFARPGWALLSAGNLARWAPPAGVRNILIAADNGSAGACAAARLHAGLRGMGLDADVVSPPPPFGDWNEMDQAAAWTKEEGGRGGAPDRRG